MTEADLQLVFDASGIKELTAQIAKLDASMAALIAEGNKAEKEMHDLGNASQNAGQQMGGMSNAISGIGGMLASAGLAVGAAEILNLGKSAVQSAINYETLSVQFEVFLGSAEKATEVLAALNKFSIETPFTPEEVNAAGRSLLAFGVDAKELIPTLKMVGDVSSATGKDFGELSVLFGKAKIAGELMSEDLNQFTEAGIPLLDELAKMYGVAAGDVKKMASDHKVSFADMQTAFGNMTGEGGRFNGMMDKMSQSTAGLLSTIEGKLQDELRAIGQALLPTVRVIAEGFEPALASVKEALAIITSTMRPFFDALGELGSAFGFAKKEGNLFATVVSMIAKYFTVISIPVRLFWTGVTKITSAFAGAVKGMKEFQENSPILSGIVNSLLGPFTLLGDAITYVGTALGFGDKEIDATTAAYNGLVRELSLVALKMGATGEQTKDFADSINLAKYATMSKADAIRSIQADFAAYIETFKDGEKVIPKVAKAITDVKNAAGPAAGSIAFLDAQMKALQAQFTATGSEFERTQIASKLADMQLLMDRMKGGADLTILTPQTVQQVSDFAAAAEHAQLALMDLGSNKDGFTEGLTAKMAALAAFKVKVYELGQSIKTDLIGTFKDFGASLAENLGKAIGMGESVGDVFKNMIAELMVQVPKLVGMALLNFAATTPGPQSLPFAVAGLALLGLSGLIGGIQAKNAQEREQMASMNGLAGGSAASGGNGRQAGPSGLGESMGGVINITLEVDKQKMAQVLYNPLKEEQLKRR